MRILYFARVRQIAGKMSEDVDVPSSVATVSDLIDFLSARDEAVAALSASLSTRPTVPSMRRWKARVRWPSFPPSQAARA